ncbi:MAG: hypothetical protein IPL11_15680 [Candidatus Accumulibacter sp.]|nr:hypothetical protein [Accumulibacter sp.]
MRRREVMCGGSPIQSCGAMNKKPDMRRDPSGVIYMSQSLRFRAPVRPGDTVHAKVTVKEVIAEKGRVVLDTVCTVGDTVVIDGEATLMPNSRGGNAKPRASSLAQRWPDSRADYAQWIGRRSRQERGHKSLRRTQDSCSAFRR